MFQVDDTRQLLAGLAVGVALGFLLHRANLTRYRVILGQFLWRDHTLLRVMLTAIVVGGLGVYTLHHFRGVDLQIQPTVLAANGGGGVVFALGMVLLGYGPATGMAALGDGSRHASFGVLGMLAGAAVYAELYPVLEKHLSAVSRDPTTLSNVTGLSPWVLLVALWGFCIVLFAVLGVLDTRPRV